MSVRIWDTASGKCEQILCIGTGFEEKVEFNQDGSKILFVTNGELGIWDIESGIEIKNSR